VSDFSALQEWKNQITAELEHNKRYLPAIRTRGKIGVVKFELNINRSGWVLPGTRIVTADPDLGRVVHEQLPEISGHGPAVLTR
jgi:hypothetical protein